MIPAIVACGDTSAPASIATTAVAATPTTALDDPPSEPVEASPGGWTTYVSKSEGFSIDMPGEPQASSRSADSPLGKLTFYFYQLSDGPAQYAAAYTDYPVDAADLDPESVLQDAIQGAAQGFDVANMQTLDVQGNSAIEGEINPPGNYVWFRGILVKNRLYQLIVSAPEAQKDSINADARRFIDSFSLLEQ